ncbi:MAG: LamG domain-containing protein, partial [Planctomycetota bacterium]
MCRKSFFLMSFILVLGLVLTNTAEAANPDLVGWWMFDDGAGTTALDSSGNGNDGTLVGGPVWVTGQIDGALQFDGADDYVMAPHIPFNSRTFTIAMWVNPVLSGEGDQVVFGQHQSGSTNLSMHFRLTESGVVRMGFYSNDLDTPAGAVADNNWYHITFWYDFGNQIRRIYIGGVQAAQDNGSPYLGTSGDTRIGQWNNNQWFRGIIDDVRVYHLALTEEEIEEIMLGEDRWEARAPNPANSAEDVSIETNLTWTRGDGAKWDLVYFGTDPCDVNLPQVDTIDANFPAEHDPGDPNLRASTTYYWYVVEVNSPNEYPGPVWSFSTIPGEAQCKYPLNGAVIPGNLHDNGNLWTYLIFDPGVSAVKHTAYFSDDYSEVYNRVEDANLGPPPYGHVQEWEYTYYAGNPEVQPANDTLVRGNLYYWTVDETDPFGNVYPGDIWEFTVQDYYAFDPSPPNNALFISPDVLLSWREGVGATKHDVYMSTSWQ